MDINKLKLNSFNRIMLKNIPDGMKLEVNPINDNPEVIIYYIDDLGDLEKFVKFCNSMELPKDNRTILIYKKGQKELNRDSIITPFKSGRIEGFKLKAPMLCSLSKEYSAFVMMKE